MYHVSSVVSNMYCKFLMECIKKKKKKKSRFLHAGIYCTAHTRREIPPTFRFHVTVVERNILIPNVLTKR